MGQISNSAKISRSYLLPYEKKNCDQAWKNKKKDYWPKKCTLGCCWQITTLDPRKGQAQCTHIAQCPTLSFCSPIDLAGYTKHGHSFNYYSLCAHLILFISFFYLIFEIGILLNHSHLYGAESANLSEFHLRCILQVHFSSHPICNLRSWQILSWALCICSLRWYDQYFS